LTRTPAARDVEIAALSARAELTSVVRVGMAIGFGVWLYLANNPFASDGGGTLKRNLLPYQSVVQDRPLDEQRMFRVLQVSLLEAEAARSTSGEWPSAAAMAADGIEPFARDPTVKGATYEWRLVRDGRFVNYLGVPAGTAAPAWLVLVQEPDPAAPAEVFVDDEDHARLLDGSILHVSIWWHPDGARLPPGAVIRMPQAEGWVQLYAAGPAAAPQISAPQTAAPSKQR
jgi:hypothetical protein